MTSSTWREVRRFAATYFSVLPIAIAAFSARDLYRHIEYDDMPCSGVSLEWGTVTLEILVVSIVVALMCGLAAAIWSLRWRTIALSAVISFIALLLFFGGVSLVAIALVDGGVGCVPDFTTSST